MNDNLLRDSADRLVQCAFEWDTAREGVNEAAALTNLVGYWLVPWALITANSGQSFMAADGSLEMP